MLSCFKIFLKPKTAAKQDIGTPKDHEAKQEVQPAVPPHSAASEGSRDKSPGTSAVRSDRRSRNLWQEAFAKLDDPQRDLLSNIEEIQGPTVVQNVADETKKRYRESHKGGGKTSQKKDKNDINLRAAAEKILSSVLRSKKLIDAGVAFDPTGHAASAWTIISLGLQIVQNDIDRLQALLEASGTLADTLARCAAIEACYRKRDLPDSDHLEDTIVEVYVSILEFSAEMVRQNKMKIFRRVLTSINSLAGPPLQDFKTKLSAKEEDLRKWNQIIENQYRKQEMEQIYQTTTSTFDKIDQMMQLLLSTEERTILKWLSEYDFSASHNYAVSQREPSTGKWIFDNSHYKNWKKSNCSLLWLYGNSGSGKTVLCSKIIDDLQDLCAKDASYAFAYWYFSDSRQSSLDLVNLLCSIIRQLCACTQTLPDKIRELWKVYHAAGGRPTRASVEEALDVLIVGLTAANQTAFIVLDALDEYPLSNEQKFSGVQQISERKDALLWLRHFTAKHENVHVMVLSRDENDIRASFDEALQVDVALGVVDDLQLFISNCINKIVEEHGWKDKYIAAMSSRVEGISEKRFRWASLMQRKFSRCLDHETMQQALETLPESLEDMYADVLTKQIPEEYRGKARLMLMWLTYSMRPLRLQELATVADLPTPMDVRRICTSSLVTFSRETLSSPAGNTWNKKPRRESEEDTYVKFDHFSVKEYLISEDLLASGRHPVSYYYVPPLLAHLAIAQLSVSHLLKTNGSHFTEKDTYVERTSIETEYDCEDGWVEFATTTKDVATEFWPDFPLLEYSTFWHNHVWEADAIEARLAPMDVTKPSPNELKAETQSTRSQAENLRTQIHRLFSDAFSQSFENWVFLLNLLTRELFYRECTKVPSPLWLASALNLPDSVQRLLQFEKNLSESMNLVYVSPFQPGYERRPVQIAAVCGHLKVLSLLLETGMHIEQAEFNHLVPRLEWNASAVLNIILEAHPHLIITELMVNRTTRSPAQDIVYKFVLNSPDLVHLSKTMFAHIVSNFYTKSGESTLDVGLVETILRRGEDVGYSRSETIEASILNEEFGRGSERVIGQCKPSSISQDLLALMVANRFRGTEMLAIVLDNYKGVQFSQDLLALIVAADHGAASLAIVLKHCKDVQVSQNLLALIFAHSLHSAGLLAAVLEHRKDIHISQDFLVATATNSVVSGGELFDLVLKYDDSIEITEDTLKAAAGNSSEGAAIFSAILNHKKKIGFSEETLKIAASINGGAMFSAMLSLDKKIEISEDILKAAAANHAHGEEVFSAILSHSKNIVISMDVMRAMTAEWRVDLGIINLLMDHGSCKFYESHYFRGGRIRRPSISSYDSHGCKFEVSQAMKEAAKRWEPDAIEFLEAHKRPNVTFVKSPPQEVAEDLEP